MKPRMPVACSGIVLAFLGASLVSLAHSSEAPISAVQKVIQMLTNMKTKGEEDKKNEQVEYSKFNTWCLEETAKLDNEIKKNKADIESLTDEIGKLENEAGELKADIAQLNDDLLKYDAEIKKETAQRENDHKEFLAEEQDYSESVDALARAIDVMKAQDYDRTGKAALLQLTEKNRIPVKVQSIVSAFLGMMSHAKGSADGKDDPLDYQAPEANAYEFQSTSIVEMLKKLEDEFRAKLAQCQKEEMNSKHAYDMIIFDLKDASENAKKDITEKTLTMQRKLKKAAECKTQLAATQVIMEANEKTLHEMMTECFEKTLSYQEKQKLRTEEIEAIEKAIQILSSPDVSGASQNHLELAQTKSAASLVQTADRRSIAAEQSEGLRGRVQEFLEAEGKRLDSKQLALLADKIAADPFAKVKKLIDQMITRLLEEAKADADHEGFCDTEIGKSKVTRTRLSEEIAGLSAAVEDGKATILELTKNTEVLSKEVSTLLTAMKEATEFRGEEHKSNELTVEDAKAAQKAIAAATAVLKDFYKKALMATGFLQTGANSNPHWGLKMGVKMGSPEWDALASPDYAGSTDTGHKAGMQTFGVTYQGQQQEAEYGVLALLEVIQSDFANLEAQTKAAEAQSQKAYDEFMIQSKKSQAKKERKIGMNSADQAAAEVQLQQDIADLKATQDELIAADHYYERLVPQCFDKGMTFDERTKARESEIESLKEALSILDSEDISTSPHYGTWQ